MKRLQLRFMLVVLECLWVLIQNISVDTPANLTQLRIKDLSKDIQHELVTGTDPL